jgi:hypothetical protein
MHADLTSSLNNSGQDDTDGTVTPTFDKQIKKYSDVSFRSETNSGKLFEDDRCQSNLSLTESEYYTAKSGFTTDSNMSSSNRK